ncbi:MAG: ATP-binding cassette domain-containing protein [Ilumatobacter sp.]|uniref:ABC transporter ATP-binding protein n=1 Tax=Ilumatobacter sp. TaxID=1967498 RepID=UPI00263A0998|nr:ATP-binding cassette domain-containing protein [Ilumatobacter sp.]MDJ0767936.1 ATP-binding cassette domain-containing protein [Ilumatobacter sp.]
MVDAPRIGPAIQTRDLTRNFGELVAVDGVDLTVRHGELFSILGPNGAGKTTTIKLLCGLLRPTSGSARVMGHDISENPLAVKQVIAVSPQETAVAEHLSARENLELMAGLHGIERRRARRRAEPLLELMGLAERAGDQARKYSGGMKRRLSIAMALVSDPYVLFLDEPTIGLDPQSRRGMWEYIERLKSRMTIVLTTHYLEEADALADRIAVVDTGRVIARGSPTQLKDGMEGAHATLVEARDLTEDAIEALTAIYPHVRPVDGGVEIDDDNVSLHRIEDCLRPRGVEIVSIRKRQVTLDDVFLELTGKELRE